MYTTKQIENLKQYIASAKPSKMGKFLYYFLPYRKKVVLHNMSLVFSHILDKKEIKKLAKCFYSHLWLLLLENIQFPFLSIEKIKDQVVVKGIEEYKNLLAEQQRAAILITGHLGNWELAPLGFMLHHPEYHGRCCIIRKSIDAAKSIEKILFRRYNDVGINVIPSKKALISVYKGLKRDKFVIFVIDQHASLKTKDGILVDFLGHQAGTYKSPALLAQNTGAPVIPIGIHRQVDKKHVLEIFPPIPWIKHENLEEEILMNTRKYNEMIEQFILAHPEQWLWTHRRWKKI